MAGRFEVPAMITVSELSLDLASRDPTGLPGKLMYLGGLLSPLADDDEGCP
jgi:hypothetical protein